MRRRLPCSLSKFCLGALTNRAQFVHETVAYHFPCQFTHANPTTSCGEARRLIVKGEAKVLAVFPDEHDLPVVYAIEETV